MALTINHPDLKSRGKVLCGAMVGKRVSVPDFRRFRQEIVKGGHAISLDLGLGPVDKPCG